MTKHLVMISSPLSPKRKESTKYEGKARLQLQLTGAMTGLG